MQTFHVGGRAKLKVEVTLSSHRGPLRVAAGTLARVIAVSGDQVAVAVDDVDRAVYPNPPMTLDGIVSAHMLDPV